jgi:hypothetical protein
MGQKPEIRAPHLYRALSATEVAGLYELERTKDSDSDGLFDAYEIYLGTDPNVADTDGDGLDDGQEVAAGTNPKISDKTVIDAVKVNSANFGLAPLSNLTATGATPHTNGWLPARVGMGLDKRERIPLRLPLLIRREKSRLAVFSRRKRPSLLPRLRHGHLVQTRGIAF